MIEHELLLLGLLKECPKHGYEIKTKIREMLSLFAGVELKSIYYPLGILEKRGLIAKRISKEGRRPQRFVYTLTKGGEARFDELLNKSFLNFKRPQFSLDLSLYFLRFARRAVVRRRLRGRIFILKKIFRGLNQILAGKQKEKDKAPRSLIPIIEHNLKMLEAETQFLQQLLQKFKNTF